MALLGARMFVRPASNVFARQTRPWCYRSLGTQAGAQSAAEHGKEETAGEAAIRTKLEQRFRGGQITVQDVSGGCGTFFSIHVSHSDFTGLPVIRQHRLVNESIAEEIKGMHGIQLKTDQV